MIGRIIKRVLHRLIRGLFRARVLVAVLLGLLLVGAAVGATQSAIRLPTVALGLPGGGRAPEATENYLKGQQTFNAELMWDSLSPETVERGQARGEAVALQQQQLDRARQGGVHVDQFTYVGGHTLPDGTSLQFYVVAMRGFAGRPDVEYVTYIFTLDRSGKITRIQ
jgi:hypothetical protein